MSGPITPHGSVVVNASFDYAHFANLTEQDAKRPEFHHIAKHELVFRDSVTSQRKRTNYNDPDLKVFASANGITEQKRKDIAFIGVSNSTLDANSHRHASITIAGLQTIINTGKNRIEAGDKVVWDVSREHGNSARKLFQTITYTKAFELGAENYFNDFKNACLGESKCSENAQECCKAFKQIDQNKSIGSIFDAEACSDFHKNIYAK
jgi:NhaP-type Na+/H+ and K+/H+ antiporter